MAAPADTGVGQPPPGRVFDMARSSCPPSAALERLLNEDLSTDERVLVIDHIERCPACQERLDALLDDDLMTSSQRNANSNSVEGPDSEYLENLRDLVSQTAFSSWHLASDGGRTGRDRTEASTACPPSIGAYEIIGEVARGGMAVVYKARQPHVGRIVAVKRLRFDDRDPADAKRFFREAEAVAALRHPNIVQVFQVGEDDGRPFLALEYIHGPTLAEFLNGSPVDPRSAAEFIRKVALAIHHAHEHGVIHRDLKPANILLDADLTSGPSGSDNLPSPDRHARLEMYEPRVTDFGLARRIGDDRTLTLPDMLAGTPAYLAPEQLNRKSDAISPACDVYALGAILYEMLTGRPPLLGPTVFATLRLVETADPVPPRTLQQNLSRDLEAVCLKCLAKEPRQRYASAADLANDLGRFLAGRPTVARPVGATARIAKFLRRHPWATTTGFVIAVAAGVGLAAIIWQWREAVHARGRLQVALGAEADQRREAEENLYYGRLAQAAQLWEAGDASQARDLLAACRPTEGGEDLRGWEWHYLSRQFRPELQVVRLNHWVNGLALLPEAAAAAPELAVAVGRPKLNATDQVRPGDGVAGFLRPFDSTPTLRPGPVLPGAATCVAVQPSGNLVAWGTNTGDVVVNRRDTGEAARAIHTPAPVFQICFDPVGAVLYVTTEDSHLRAFDANSGRLIHDQLAQIGRPWALAVHPKGGLVACGGWTGVVRLYDPNDWRTVCDLRSDVGAVSLAFSADGTSLAVGGSDGTAVIWNPTTRQEVRRIATNGGPVYSITFQPDGKALAVGGADRTVRLYDTATEALRSVYRGHESGVRSLAFVSGGERLVSGGQDGTARVWDATKDVRGRLIRFDNRLNDAAFLSTQDGLCVVAASGNGRVAAWRAADGRSVGQRDIRLMMRQAYPRRYMTYVDGGRRIAGIDRDHSELVGIWDAISGERVATLASRGGPVQILAANRSGRLLAWASSAGEEAVLVSWWNGEAGQSEPSSVRLPVRGLFSLAADTSSDVMAAIASPSGAGGEQGVWVFDRGGNLSPRVVIRGGEYRALTFSPDGRFLAVAGDAAVQIYRTETWELASACKIPPATTCLAFSPDGRRLVAVGYDGTATFVDPVAGKRVFQLPSLSGSRPDEMASDARVAFSPDGSMLLSTNWDGSINVWDGTPIQPSP
jgi:serine/threonine protein kinase/WD40 repeat protein